MSKPKQVQVKFNKHWGSWAKGYLKLAELGFLYLKNQQNIGKKKWSRNQPKALFSLGDGSMFIAAIWNIKHSIELTIKGLGIQLDKKYCMGHNLSSLLVDLEGKLKPHCLKRDINLLSKIVDKYVNCRFSRKTTFFDTENTFFKYPEINNNSLDYSFVHDFLRRYINQFLRDIHNIRVVYNIIEAQPQHFKEAATWGVSKREIKRQLLSVSTMRSPGYKKG